MYYILNTAYIMYVWVWLRQIIGYFRLYHVKNKQIAKNIKYEKCICGWLRQFVFLLSTKYIYYLFISFYLYVCGWEADHVIDLELMG